MSLRAQIHDAIDDIASPAPTLERRVKAFVLADAEAGKRFRTRPTSFWTTRVRGTLALVATALILVLIGGLIVGGRFWRNQSIPPVTIGQNELNSLESQHLNYPLVAPGAPCPAEGPHLDPTIGMVIGRGPVFLINSDVYESNEWGLWVALDFAANLQKNPGLVLVRARDLQSNAQVAFATYPLEPTPMTAVGVVLGTSVVANHKVKMRSEAAVPDMSTWPSFPALGSHVDVISLLGMQRGGSGCIGFQIDAAGFSENFVAQLRGPGV